MVAENANEIFLDEDKFPDEMLQAAFTTAFASMPWQFDEVNQGHRDADGFSFSLDDTSKQEPDITRKRLQEECWRKFNRSPQINTAVRGLGGRVTGFGFEQSSENIEIDDLMREIILDHRNRLFSNLSKYEIRAIIEGELMLMFTLHDNGFIEIDFIDPVAVEQKGTDDTGILFHPNKPNMPLFYNINTDSMTSDYQQVPSINIARFPELIEIAKTLKKDGYDTAKQKGSKNRKKRYQKIGGFNRFVVAWDRGYITKRAVSYLRTTLEWLNHYENLKKYEIDHKKSMGSWVWNYTFEDMKAFRTWMALSDSDKKNTAILEKKTPGSTLISPPGMKLEAVGPKLPSLSGQDTDILDMVQSGLNEAADITSGNSTGTFASVKETRGPMSDRISDELIDFDRFMKHDFWSGVFFLRSVVTDFPEIFKIKETVGFEEDKTVTNDITGLKEKENKSIKKTRNRKPEELVDISYPVSEMIDYESRARAFFGVKHGPLSETLGAPNKILAQKMGMGNYAKMRFMKADEDEKYPDLAFTIDAESLQETKETEPARTSPGGKE